MTCSDFPPAPAGAAMMTAIAVFKEKTDDFEHGEIAVQIKAIHVVTQDPFIAMRGFAEGMTTILSEEAITIEVRDHQPIDEPEQRRLIEEDAALLGRDSQTKRSVCIAMGVVGVDPAAGFPDARQRVWEVVRDRQLDIKRVRDCFQSVGRRLKR